MRVNVLLSLATYLSLVAPLTLAWSDQGFPPNALAVRRESSDQSSEASTKASEKSATESASEETTATASGSRSKPASVSATATATDDGGGGDLNTAKPDTETGTGKHKGDSKHHTEYPFNSPAGAISMMTPATIIMPTPLYKIGDNVTFGWNYTDLLGTPKAIDVMISRASSTHMWTLTANMSFESAGAYEWDTNDQASNNDDDDSGLSIDLYTLVIKDSESQVTDVPNPGYLGVYSGLTFGLYTGQPYTPYAKWECPGTCSAGVANIARNVVVMALSMSLVTLLSFTWFVTGLNLR